jgi:hypothetical protein
MIPQLQIRQQPSLLEMESSSAYITIHQERPQFEIKTRPADLQIEQPEAIMTIDQHDALRAYNGGTSLEINNQIYSNLPRLFLESLAKRVEQGNRLAQFHLSGNSIAEVYGGDWKRDPFVEFRAPASYDNVHISVERQRPQITVQVNLPQVHAQAFKPEIEYHPGNFNIRVKQYASVKIIPPEINMVV